MTGNAPDLIQRAAARLQTRRQEDLTQSPISARDQHPTTIAAPVTPVYPSPLRTGEGKQDFDRLRINLSPTALAANGIVLPTSGFSRTKEEFRAIKRHVLSLIARGGNGSEVGARRVILVTSARPGEGKTFTATNLALALATEKDARVLLMDADAYRQSLMTYLGLSANAGWIDCIADGQSEAESHVIHTNVAGFSVLPTGKERGEIPELMSSQRMKQLIDDLVRKDPGRFIIMDALPCLTSTEPTILASLAGQTLFVVAAHKTSRDDIESSLRLLTNSPNVSLILNKTEPLLTEQFKGYGYDYAHQR